MEKKRLRTKADVGKNDGGMEEEPDDIITRRDHSTIMDLLIIRLESLQSAVDSIMVAFGYDQNKWR